MSLRDRIRTVLARGPLEPDELAAALQVELDDLRAVVNAMRAEGHIARKLHLTPKPKPEKSKPVPIERHARGKLTDRDRAAIRASGEPSSAVARRYGVHRATVWNVRGTRR